MSEGDWLRSDEERAAVTDKQEFNAADKQELIARRANEARQVAAYRAKYHGWKPLPIWYTFWAILIGIGGLASGSVGSAFAGLVVAGLLGWYVHYLYSGGKHRVWFIVF